MIDAPTRGSCIGGHVSTPSKELIIQVSADEENQPINQVDDRLCSKRCSPEKASIHKETVPLADSRPDKRSRAMDQPDIGSDCDTDVSSTVCARREWLKEFGKQHENTLPRKTTSSQPIPARSSIKSTVPPPAPMSAQKPSRQSNTESAASVLVNRMISDPPKRSFALPGYKPKMRPDEVQATNEGYASVAKLSEWLANDPTSTKKKKHVRRGKNIINKSRTFEKDMENVIVIETNMPRGAVKDRTKMIQGAFKDEGKIKKLPGLGSLGHKNAIPRYAMSEIGTGDISSRISVAEKKDWLKKAFKTAIEETPKVEAEEGRSVIIFNDAASSLSVSDKKDWLKNAFKNASSESPATKLGHSKAMTDIMHDRGGDDAASRAKRRFLERSRRTPTKAPPQADHAPERECDIVSPSIKSDSKQDEHVCLTDTEERTGPPLSGSIVEPECNFPVEKDQTPVDFKTARQALIQRGKQNGHPMQVVNKVYMKKTKFEKLEIEQRRRSTTQSLLKASWEEADSTTGLPSNAYDKKFVPNIAPKKSFEELP